MLKCTKYLVRRKEQYLIGLACTMPSLGLPVSGLSVYLRIKNKLPGSLLDYLKWDSFPLLKSFLWSEVKTNNWILSGVATFFVYVESLLLNSTIFLDLDWLVFENKSIQDKIDVLFCTFERF